MPKKQTSVSRIVITALLSVLLLGSVVLFTMFMVRRLDARPLSDNEVVVRAQDFGIWSYGATRSEIDPLHATVNYKHDSVADLKAYVDANKALLPQVVKLGGNAEVAVSFAYPVTVNWFLKWAKASHFQIDSVQMLTGISFSVTSDHPLPPDESGRSIDDNGLGSLFGTYGSIDAAYLAQLWSEPKIFLVDVTPAWVRYDLVQAGIQEPLRDRIQVGLAYGYTERLGLQNFTELAIPSPPTTVEPILLSPAPDQ